MTQGAAKTLSRTKDGPKTGIVHLGLGAFFRAHGAIYIKEAMARSGGDWGVTGVSLRSPSVRDTLAPQGCLYTAVELSDDGLKPQEVDVVTDVLVAPENPTAVLQVMAAETTKIVSLTITEKGYCRGSSGPTLDLNNPDIRHDLTHDLPRSAPGFIVRALEARRKRDLRPFTVLCLDNLPANGRLTKSVICELAQGIDPDLAHWIETECCFPSTMVDRIVPATTPDLIQRLARDIGIHDPGAVAHEPFRQWVIEDRFVDDLRPDLGAVGAELVGDVEPYEHMKLRMLNGTHSALAYMGSLAGHETVAEAIADARIASFLDGMWQDEIAPSLDAPPGCDLGQYASALRGRYGNREIRHLLVQIAMDGSQKLPQRILDPLFENLKAGRSHGRLLAVLAAWIRFLEFRAKTASIDDPLAEELTALIRSSDNDRQLVDAVLDLAPVFGRYPVGEIAEDLVKTLNALSPSAINTFLDGIAQ